MQIDKIKKLKNGKYKLCISGNKELVTHGEVILKNNLLNQTKINETILLKLNFETEYYDIYNKVIKYIQRRLRSEKEIIQYLEKNKVNVSFQTQIIKDLKLNNFINDYLFAKAFVADKINLSKAGPYQIKRELIDHNIGIEIIEKLINEIDYNDIYEKLTRLISKKILVNKKYSKYQLKSKILSEYVNLGYSKDLINDLFEKLYINDNNIIKKEYDKIYNKLKNKYDDSQLYLQIKKGLFKKGFLKEEIDELMNK